MKYWYHLEGASPLVSTMASDFLSAPGESSLFAFCLNNNESWAAASTDAERAFSKGRREVNFMQHNMSSQTFKSEMAVGSWDGTPLMPDIQGAIAIMERKMSRGSSASEDMDTQI